MLVKTKNVKNVVGSAAEAEIAGIFERCQEGIPIRQTLIELNHKQPPTPLKTDNKTANGIINENMKPRKTRAMDMRYHWIRDRVQQGQFKAHWERNLYNLADYFTKKHNTAHHRRMRRKYLVVTPLDQKCELASYFLPIVSISKSATLVK